MDPFIAEIRLLPYSFAPRDWALCNGQILSISQNPALFSLLGTTYGGDGKSTFALPNLQGSVVMHPGQGPGLSPHDLGESGGSDKITLVESEMPAHPHPLSASTGDGNATSPVGQRLANGIGLAMYAAPSSPVALDANVVAPVGGGAPHNNLQPYLTMNYCIALQGIYPARE